MRSGPTDSAHIKDVDFTSDPPTSMLKGEATLDHESSLKELPIIAKINTATNEGRGIDNLQYFDPTENRIETAIAA